MNHLDDLPERSEDHVGETESRDAFRLLFRDPYFLIRAEAETDYGVDIVIEALLDSNKPSNIKTHAQLKSSGKEPNKDGTYSYQVDRTNLNYLLNNPRSFYAFYSRQERRFLYRWAEDVLVEYEQTGPAWRSQDKVTVRFLENLDAGAMSDINKATIQAAKSERDLRLSLMKAGMQLSGIITYDADTGVPTDVTAALTELDQYGLALSSGGHADRVLKLVDEIPPARLATARRRLIVGFAAYQVGRNGASLDSLSECDVDSLQNDDEKALASMVLVAVRRSVGLLDREMQMKALQTIEDTFPSSMPVEYARLERVRDEGMSTQSQESVRVARAIASRLERDGIRKLPLALQARIVAHELEFYSQQREFREQVIEYRVTEVVGVADAHAADRAAAAVALLGRIRTWMSDFEATIGIAEGMQLSFLAAEAKYTYASCIVQNTLADDKLVPMTEGLSAGRAAVLASALARVDAIVPVYAAQKAHEGVARVKMLRLELLWLLGRRGAVRTDASELAKFALRHSLADHYKRATAISRGESPCKEFDQIPALFGA